MFLSCEHFRVLHLHFLNVKGPAWDHSLSHLPLLCTRRDLYIIFARTLHLFNRSPQTLQRRSFSSTPPSSPSLNASRTGSPLSAQSRHVSADFDRFKMAFNSFGASNPADGSAPAELGPELSEVYTDVRRPATASVSFCELLSLTASTESWLQGPQRRCQHPATSHPMA